MLQRWSDFLAMERSYWQQYHDAIIRKFVAGIFWAMVILAIALRFYQGHAAGIISDEAYSYLYFSQSPQAALTDYHAPNNHVLNSLAIYLSSQCLGWYEHCIRIPVLILSVFYCLAGAYVVRKAIHAVVWQFATLLVLLFCPLLFQFTILARGYGYGLACLLMGYAMALYFIEKSLRRITIYECVAIPCLLSLLNFICLGAMPSTAVYAVAFNISFLALLYAMSAQKMVKKTAAWCFLLVPLTTLGTTYLLYYQVLPQMWQTLNNPNTRGLGEFGDFVGGLFNQGLLPVLDLTGHDWASVLAIVLVTGISLILVLRYRSEKRSFRLFILSNTILVLVFIFIHALVLRKNLGFQRNGVFLIPILALVIFSFLDLLTERLPHRALSALGQWALVLCVAMMMIKASPRLTTISHVDWLEQSVSGPAIRYLHNLDRTRYWRVGISPNYRFEFTTLSVYYYSKFFKVKLASEKRADILFFKVQELQKYQDKPILYEFRSSHGVCGVWLKRF